jgi:hypothetical protein
MEICSNHKFPLLELFSLKVWDILYYIHANLNNTPSES